MDQYSCPVACFSQSDSGWRVGPCKPLKTLDEQRNNSGGKLSHCYLHHFRYINGVLLRVEDGVLSGVDLGRSPSVCISYPVRLYATCCIVPIILSGLFCIIELSIICSMVFKFCFTYSI